MPARGIAAKAVIEGPPPRACPILLRQTSFKALEEPILFGSGGAKVAGTHTARFGEIEQRGLALTRKGRALYDDLLAAARRDGVQGGSSASYEDRLADAFKAFPDDHDTLRLQGLGFFKYALRDAARRDLPAGAATMPIEDLVRLGIVDAFPIVYEDFLPVSAAGIFQSNLGDDEQRLYEANSARAAFTEALGVPVLDEFEIYEQMQAASVSAVRAALRQRSQVAAPGAMQVR